jgi:hypothetical protein
MAAIMALLAAASAAPSCPASVGEPVVITSTVLPVKAIGGSYHSGIGWPPPGEARVGLVRFEWGLLLQSIDPRFADFDLSPGSVHSRSSGCWFQWENRWGKHGVEAIAAPHIGESGYTAGYVPQQPTKLPAIDGYRFVSADKAFSPDYAWVGLWNATDGSARSQVIAFSDQRHKTLAAIPFLLGGLSAMPSPDTPALGITIIGEGKDSSPVPYFELLWMSGIREAGNRAADRP